MNRLAVVSGAVCLMAASMGACDEEPAGPMLGESFTLVVGQRVTLDTVHASVRFLAVSEDSRCPSRVQCVWAGNGAVVLEIAPTVGDAAEDTLHTNLDSGLGAVVIASYELTLLQLDPYPETPGGITSDDYRVTLALYERLEGQLDHQ